MFLMNDTSQTHMSQWLTVREAAQQFNVSESWIRKEIREGRLRHYRAGQKILIKPEDMESVFYVVEPFVELVDEYH
jgi:excisionase family DNA binding protein